MRETAEFGERVERNARETSRNNKNEKTGAADRNPEGKPVEGGRLGGIKRKKTIGEEGKESNKN